MQDDPSVSFDALEAGDSVTLQRVLRPADLTLFARLSGADGCGLWGMSVVLAGVAQLVPGARVLAQSLAHAERIEPGDAVVLRLRVQAIDRAARTATLHCHAANAAGERLVEGELRIAAPPDVVDDVPHEAGHHYRRLIEAAGAYAPIATAVVHPCDALSLEGALEAARLRLLQPVLVGPLAKIRRAAAEAGCSIDGLELVDAPHSHAAAVTAVALAREGKVQALMKGALHTDELMEAVVDRAGGLRTERRMSHVFALDVPTYPKPLFITDAAINIAPDLADKRDIVQNAIDLAHALGIALPAVAIVSAVETVNPKLASTIDAAALCKMLDRGQITGARLDGPLAFDNAISRLAARAKAIASDVAGNADVLVVPDLESGNLLVKQLVYLSGAIAAGIVLGARVPVMLTSRADTLPARLASAALAQLFVHHQEGRR
jgi:phosphotransacetylase